MQLQVHQLDTLVAAEVVQTMLILEQLLMEEELVS
jgi:hypothetical protein